MPDKHEESTAPPGAAAGEAANRATGETASRSAGSADHSAGEDWRARAEEAERELVFTRAIRGVDWLDPDDAYAELTRHAQRDDSGAWRVTLPAGRAGSARENAGPLSPEQAAKELAARKPHWVRARAIGGTGAGGGEGGTVSAGAGVAYRDLLKPENRDLLREYLYERPEDLERLRQAHFKK